MSIQPWMTDPKAHGATEGGIKAGWRVSLGAGDDAVYVVRGVDQSARTVTLEGPEGASRVVPFASLDAVVERPITAWEASQLAPFFADPEVCSKVAHLLPCELADWVWTAWSGMKGGRRGERILNSLRTPKVAQNAHVALPTGHPRNAEFIKAKNTPQPPSPSRVAKNARAGKDPQFDKLPDPTSIA
jgi:hypothetical protein